MTLRDRITLGVVLVSLAVGIGFSVLGNPFSGAPAASSPGASTPLPTTPVGRLLGVERGAERLQLTPKATEQLFAQYDASFQILGGLGSAADPQIAAQRARCAAAPGAGATQRTLAEYCDLTARVAVSLNTFETLCTDLEMCGGVAGEMAKVVAALATQTRTLARETRAELPAGRCRTAMLPTHADVVLWSDLARYVGALAKAAKVQDRLGAERALVALQRFIRRSAHASGATGFDPDAVMDAIARRCGMRWAPAAGTAAPAAGGTPA